MTCRKQWPDVGDTQRISVHAERGFAIAQNVPRRVEQAYANLVGHGFRLRPL